MDPGLLQVEHEVNVNLFKCNCMFAGWLFVIKANVYRKLPG